MELQFEFTVDDDYEVAQTASALDVLSERALKVYEHYRTWSPDMFFSEGLCDKIAYADVTDEDWEITAHNIALTIALAVDHNVLDGVLDGDV